MNKWEVFVMSGGEMPTIELPDVPVPDGIYVCRYCGEVSTYLKTICDSCKDEGRDVEL